MEKNQNKNKENTKPNDAKSAQSAKLFSCVGNSGYSEAKLVYTGRVPKGTLITDSYITSCVMECDDIESGAVWAHIYACNIDDGYIKNTEKNKRLPMLHMLINYVSVVTTWALGDCSVWFIPNSPNTIRLVKKGVKFEDIVMCGKFECLVKTFTDEKQIKETHNIPIPGIFPSTNQLFIESIRTNSELRKLISNEWKLMKDKFVKSNDDIIDKIKGMKINEK